METICDLEKCYGCFLCEEVCPKKAIKMNYKKNGFFYPVIDNEKCIDCKICQNRCLANNQVDLYKIIKSYSGWNLDDKERISSSSGGVFSAFANYFLENDGVVVGACFENEKLGHKIITKKENLEMLKKSKYIQSNLTGLFSQIKMIADSGKNILYVSTPCQVAALRNFLKRDYNNILFVDLICHGVGSTLIFEDELNEYKKKYNSEISNISFRDSYDNWTKYVFSLSFISGKKISEYFALTPFGHLFTRNFISRESCYTCSFSNANRIGDITLGDYGGDFYKQYGRIDIKNGISSILINSETGLFFFNKIKKELKVKEIQTDEIISTSKRLNLVNANGEMRIRNEIIQYYLEYGYKNLVDKFCNISNKDKKAYKYSGKWLGNINQLIYKVIEKFKKIIKIN